ncbi:MAG TPA: CsbD family protein [Solirubrobacteraceae bacterium]|jgi:uncharacterized protein YjbJ (UPF0337 family)|nr:CsbD family protein [Solirubrobacteraceae bacterium]
MTDETLDKAKGRVKEAAGAVSGDSSLKNEGRAEQAKGSVKKAAEKVQEAITGHKGDPDY